MLRSSLTAVTVVAAASFAASPAWAGGYACDSKDAKTGVSTASASEKPSIVGTAQQAGKFNTLLAAAQAAGLAETLDQGGPFTVLAPTDEAFAALPDGTVESLLKPENKETLKAILLYHVIDGEVPSGTVVTLDEAATLQGGVINIQTTDEGVMINNANVIKTDIAAGNGVIHVIDTVLLPPAQASADSAGKNAS
ncbi:MAG: fasciclin domain-containing protein [Planctomycetota bacterium]